MSESAFAEGSSSIQRIQAQVEPGIVAIETGQAQFGTLEGNHEKVHQALVEAHKKLGSTAGIIGNLATSVGGLRELAQQAAKSVNEGAAGIAPTMKGSAQTQAKHFPEQAALFSERAGQVDSGYASIEERLTFLQSALLGNLAELSEISILLSGQHEVTKRATARSKRLRRAARMFLGRL